MLFIVAACNKEQTTPEGIPSNEQNIPEEVSPTGEMISIQFTADYPSLEGVKSTVTDAGVVSWEKDDEVTLYFLEGGTPSTATAVATTSGSSVVFSATIPSTTTAIWASYPAGTGALTSGGVFSIDLDNVHTGLFTEANYAVAYTAISDMDDIHMNFKNVAGLFRIPIPEGGEISQGGRTYTLGSITISDKTGSPAFLGSVTVSANAESGELEFSAASSPKTATAITLDATSRAQDYVYIPSLPVESAAGLVFRFTDTGGKAIPAVVTKDGTAISLERGHIKPASAVEAIVWDWYFSPSGTGNGRSSESSAGVEDFQDILNATSTTYGQWRLDGATLHLADGTYSLTSTITISGTEAVDISIKGESMDGTKIDGAALAKRMFYSTAAANLKFSDLTIQNAALSSGNGSAINIADGSLEMENCKLYANTASNGNSGAIYVGAPSTFTACTFESNSARNQGGAFSVGGSVSDLVSVKDCTFKSNSVTATGKNGGGAIYHAGVGRLTIDNTSFIGNSAYTCGGAIRMEDKAGLELFVNRSLFRNNTVAISGYHNPDGCAAIYQGAATKGKLGLFNCTFSYNHASSSASATPVMRAGRYVVANCSFIEATQSGYGVINNAAAAANSSTIVNSIVTINSSTASHVSLSTKQSSSDDGTGTYNYLTSGYNLVTRILSGFTAASDDTSTGVNVKKSTIGLEDYVNDNTYVAWEGDVSAVSGYSKCSLSNVETLVKANTVLGADFWNWLEGITVTHEGMDYKATQVDVRGVPRNTTTLWPGSYQQDSKS